VADARLPEGPHLPPLVQSYLYTRRPEAFLSDARQRYGDVFTLNLSGQGRTVLVCAPDLVKDILTGPTDVFRAGAANDRMRGLLGPKSLLVIDGDEHVQARRALLPTLHGESVSAHEGLIARLTADRVGRWPRGQPLPMHRESRAIMTEAIVKVVLGDRYQGAEEMRSLLSRLMRVTPWVNIWLTHERLGAIPPWRKYAEARRRAGDRIDEAVLARSGGDCDRGADVLSKLVRNGESDPDWLRSQAMTLLVAHDTATAALAWAVELLGRHPQVRARAREEGDAYLDAVVTEALRVRTVLPGAARMIAQDVDLGPYRLPAGTTVVANSLLMSADPRLYEDPHRFRPDRWLDRRPGTYTWLPFGGGQRRCIGATFAQMELRVALREMLERIDWRAVGSRPERQEIRLSIVPGRGGLVSRIG
jgi:cytochrome P450